MELANSRNDFVLTGDDDFSVEDILLDGFKYENALCPYEFEQLDDYLYLDLDSNVLLFSTHDCGCTFKAKVIPAQWLLDFIIKHDDRSRDRFDQDR